MQPFNLTEVARAKAQVNDKFSGINKTNLAYLTHRLACRLGPRLGSHSPDG